MADVIPPAPVDAPFGSYNWQDWYFKVRNAINAGASIAWSQITNFTGSSIAQLANHDHTALTTTGTTTGHAPTGGATSTVLTKTGPGDFAYAWLAPAAAPTGANPSASAGLTAVNGAAATFMRSDGAPAISQAIAPTWTGAHTFTPASGTTRVLAGDILHGIQRMSIPVQITGNTTVATTFPINSATTGGLMLLISGADGAGVAFTKLYLIALRVGGGAAPDIASVLITTAGSATPSFTFSNVAGFLNVTAASNNYAIVAGIG